MVLEIPELAPGLNGSKGLMRMHYHTYRKVKEKWIRLVSEAAGSSPGRIDRCEVLIERYYTGRPLDLDNAYASAKIPLDALRRVGIIPDDDPSCVTALRVEQIRVPKKTMRKTVIRIKPLRTKKRKKS